MLLFLFEMHGQERNSDYFCSGRRRQKKIDERIVHYSTCIEHGKKIAQVH